MNNKKTLIVLIILIFVLSVFASLVGILFDSGLGMYEIESFRGESIKIYGKGLYKYDSVAIVA